MNIIHSFAHRQMVPSIAVLYQDFNLGILVKSFKYYQSTHNSIQHHSFVCTQLNYFNYCYISLTIELNISHLFTQLNDQSVQFLTIQFSLSHLFAHSLNVTQFYLTHRQDPVKCYQSVSEWTWEQWQWRSTPHSPKLQDWTFTIRLFSVISRTLVAEIQLMYTRAQAD